MAQTTRTERRDGEGGAKYLLSGEDDATFPPDRTALLVIDPVNDFCSEGGAGWELTKSTLRMNDVIGNLKRLIEGARERGVPVLFGPMAFTEEDYRDGELQRRSGINRVMFERKMFLAGTWGAEFHPDLEPRDGDVVLLPHKGIDVFETDLPDHLRRLGTTHLVIAGLTANLCCESTGRHAMEEGYDVTFIRNAIASENVPSYEAAIHISFPLIANAVLEVDDFLGAVDASGAPSTPVQQGDKVLGSDHGEIGDVERVEEGDEETLPHLVVSRGMIFEREAYVPLDAVTKRTGGRVFLNVPKVVVGKMPWDERPTRAAHREKMGPALDGVRNLYGTRGPTRFGK